MASNQAPRSRADFYIAVLCALELEAECIYDAFDRVWDSKKYIRLSDDTNAYTLGLMGEHNVVLISLPGMGTERAAFATANLKSTFPNIRLSLVVGICGGMPYGINQEEILLGDVIISEALINYDFGRQYPQGFRRKSSFHDVLGPPNEKILGLLRKLKMKQHKVMLQNNTTMFLEEIRQKSPETFHPGAVNDVLHHASYTHRHRQPTACDLCGAGDMIRGTGDMICQIAVTAECDSIACDMSMQVTRLRLADPTNTSPKIHFGIMGSSNTVMRSGHHRDALAEEGIIAVEMEGAGVWRSGPTLVIKSVCDYADTHKRKGWQRYAAATAAACAKAFLLEWNSDKILTVWVSTFPIRPTCHACESVTNMYFDVPRRRVKNFFGREDELAKITTYFDRETDRPRILILQAMGGQGKTQIALEYCHRARRTYLGVFWVNSTSISSITQSLAHIAQRLDSATTALLPDDDARAKFAIRSIEQCEHRCLIVLDNCDDPTTFSTLQEQYLPQVGKGNFLLTSRHHSLEELGSLVKIPPMPQEAGINLLLHRYNGVRIENYLSEAVTIVDRLGNLALAIDQASAYIQYTQLPIDELSMFLPRYVAQRERILQYTTQNFWRYTKMDDSGQREDVISAFTTWEMSFQSFLSNEPHADSIAHFLTLSAFFAQTHVNEALFKCHWLRNAYPPDWMTIFSIPSLEDNEKVDSYGIQADTITCDNRTTDSSPASEQLSLHHSRVWDSDQFWRLIYQAFQMSLLQSILPATEDGEASLSFHPLIRDWLQLRQTLKERQAYTREAVDVCCSLVQILSTTTNSTAQIWMTGLLHVDAVVACDAEFFDEASCLGRELSTCGKALCLAKFYTDRGKYSEAEQIHHDVVEVRQRTLGAEHPDTHAAMNSLAVVLQRQGKHAAAEQMHRKTIAIQDRVLGAEHLNTLITMNNLATVLYDQGNYREAERMYREVMYTQERVLGPEHPHTLISRNNFALTLRDRGKYKEAEHMYREAVEIRKRVEGIEHPSTLYSMNNLATVLQKQGIHSEAEQIHREVVEVRERTLGAEHTDTLISMNNLAQALHSQGNHSEAEQMQREVVEVQKRVEGPEHPGTFASISNLALVLRDRGRHREAERMYREVMEVQERVLGAEHPDTLVSKHNLALVLDNQGEYGEAEQMYREVIETQKRVLWVDHPHTLVGMSNLALLLCTREKYIEAEPVQLQALKAAAALFGPQHPRTQKHCDTLQKIWTSLGRPESETRSVLQDILGGESDTTMGAASDSCTESKE